MKKVLLCLAGCCLLAINVVLAQDSEKEWDTRWFISPLLKLQVQDFGLLEKNKLGHLSDANTLSFQEKVTASFAASAYKNLSSHFSISADIGLGYGHVTSEGNLISQTDAKTYNLLNATIYYHLLSARYRLQPFLAVGINNLINDESYSSAPVGLGLKFSSNKIMITGEAAYGYAISPNIANTVVYSIGMYLPIKSKKKKDKDEEDSDDDSSEKENKKKKKKDKDGEDSVRNGQSPVINNIYINMNMDSLINAKRGAAGNQGDNGETDAVTETDPFAAFQKKLDDEANEQQINNSIQHAMGLRDYEMDTIDGKPVMKYTVYFYYDEYSLTTRAFTNIDRVVSQLKKYPTLKVSIKGHTDQVGSDDYNEYLSKRRAQMVFDYLLSKGVNGDRLSMSYYGKEKPAVNTNDPNRAWLNRRVEILLRED